MSRPLRLLLFNLVTDESDPVLGFTANWIRELAARCAYVDVITMYRGSFRPPDNARVFSAGRERGLSKPARVASFYRQLLPLLAARRYDACFAHMMPLFAALAGPLLSARGIPTVLWYTHRQRSATLRLALALSRRVISADATSFPYRQRQAARHRAWHRHRLLCARAFLTERERGGRRDDSRWSCKWRAWRRSSIRRRPSGRRREAKGSWH